MSTIDCFRKLGVAIRRNGDTVTIEGKGWDGLKEPKEILDVGNSGTTTRLILGILATRPFHSVVIGDSSIASRPMARVTDPLKKMGADIAGREGGNYTPLSIRGGNTKAISFQSTVASARLNRPYCWQDSKVLGKQQSQSQLYLAIILRECLRRLAPKSIGRG